MLSGESVYCQEDSITMDTVDYLPVSDTLGLPGSLRQVPDRKLMEYQRSPDFAYANDPAYWKKAPPQEPGLLDWFFGLLLNPGVRLTIFILFLLLVIYAIYRLARENSFSWFARNSKKNQAGVTTNEEEELTGMDLDEAIRKYRETGNFALAVRYMYLKVIYTAFEKKAILVKASSTNSEMVESFRDPQQARDFRFLATAYEYIFYGGFIPSQEQFDLLQRRFNAFQENLGN
jgi:hypothetical protein